jgi:formate dehydrogenase beta subunit
MEFERLEWDAAAKNSKVIDTVVLPCDDVILAIGQDNAFPWIERDLGIEFDQYDMPAVDKVTFESSRPGVFFGGDAAWGPKNIIWAVEHAHQAAISIHNHCQGIPVSQRPGHSMNLISQKMGLSEWSYHNDFNPASASISAHFPVLRLPVMPQRRCYATAFRRPQSITTRHSMPPNRSLRPAASC